MQPTPSTENLALPFGSVVVANRGEIACRIIETLRRLGIRSIAVYSDADRGARHVQLADIAVRIGPAPAAESYLNVAAVMTVVLQTGADAVHPGYGFLSESTALAEACASAGVIFVGPGETALAVMGDKIRSKRHVSAHGVPVTPGSEQSGTALALDDEQLEAAAAAIGYPVLVKPSAGGGGKGMHAVFAATEMPAALLAARRIARAAFGDDTLFVEKLIERPRHIEVQLLADRAGNTVHLGERECSLQRRHQKVIEEAPSPLLSAETRARIGEAACAVARSVGYEGAGTVEFLVPDARPDEFFFMEMNTRLQVEHPVTEMITGIDIVEWQLRVAAGQTLPWAQSDIVLTGHAIEARVYAEDAEQDFLPTTGTVLALSEARGSGVRVDSSLELGLEISSYYDPMLAKVIAWGPDREAAMARLDGALAETVILGVETNIPFLSELLADAAVRSGSLDTGLIARMLEQRSHAEDAVRLPSRHLAVAAALVSRQKRIGREAISGDTVASPLWQGAWGWSIGDSDAARTRTMRLLSSRADVEYATEAQLLYERGGGALSVTLQSRRASEALVEPFVADARHHVLLLGALGSSTGSAGAEHVQLDGVVSLWHWAIDGETLWVAGDGTSFHCEMQSREAALAVQLDALRAARHAAEGSGPASPELRTPMPGTVVQLHVASGDHIERGAPVLTVEAMKMERAVLAPVSGIVRVHVAQGEAVARNQLVATIEPAEKEAEGKTP